MTGQSKFLKICTNAYHPSERDKYKLLRRITYTNINENASSQSLDTTDFYPEDSESLLLGTTIVSIKTCDQDGCPIVLLTTDSGVFTCSCSEEEYTYLYQLLVDKDFKIIGIYRTDLCDDKDANMTSSHQDVISLKKYRDVRENEILVCKQTIERLFQAHNHALQDAASVKQTDRHLLLDNIFTLLLHQKEQTKKKSLLDIIFDIEEVEKQLTDQKGQAKGEIVNGYETDKISSFPHAHGEGTTSSMLPEIIKEHPNTHLPSKVQSSDWKAIAKKLQDLTMLDNLLTLKSSNYGNFDIESHIRPLTEIHLNEFKDKTSLDSFSSSSKSFLKMLYESLQSLQKDFDGFDFLNGKSPADKNNEQKENKNLAEKKPKEDNENENIKNVTDLHSTDDDTDVKTDEADQDIDLKDKTKDEKESTTKSENHEHREHGEGMRSIQKLKGSVAICVDKKEKGIPCVAQWVSNSKTPVLYVSNIELLRQLIQNEFSEDNQQDKKNKEFLMQFVTHGYGRFRQGRMSLQPLTHTEMNMFLDMDIYLNRVSTFVDWPNKSISSLQLAKAGFIYEGEGEKVRCFSCGLTISDFPAEFVPMNFHHAESNNCNFLKSLESNNASEIDNNFLHDAVSEEHRDGKTQPHIQNEFPQTDQDQNNDNMFDSIFVTDKTQTRHNGLDSSSILQSTRTHTDIDERSVKDRPRNHSLNWTVDNNSNLSDNILGSAKHPQFIGIHNRLKSFIGWSHRHIKEPRYFVEAGFYFTGKEDIVRCFFCDIGLAEWISEDDPWVEHARHSPSCLFVIEKRGREFVENIQRKWRQIYCPKHIEFEELGARIRSFSNWPLNIIQRPEQLASAGFYYTGKNDEVRCHYCTGGLKGWEEGDEPWTEHARWFPSCKFLIKSKGSAYIEEIARKYNSNHVADGSRRTRGQDDQSTNLAKESKKIDKESASIDQLQRAIAKLATEIFVCIRCKNAERCMIFVPCGHRLVCEPCSKKLKRCLHCNKSIKKCIKTYLS